MTSSTRSFKDQADLQGLTGDAIIELMILDLYPIDSSIPSDQRYVYFCNWTVSDGQPVYYGADQYVPLPYQSSGWQIKGNGVPPNPTIVLGNIGLEWSGLINTWEDLIGAKLTRRRVLARYLSSSAGSPRTDHWPDEIWFVQQKESENKLAVTFRLSTAFDLDGIQLPRRRCLRYTCMWEYRGTECGYTGPPVADINDNPFTTSGRTDAVWTNYEAALAAYKKALSDLNAGATTLVEKQNALAATKQSYTVFSNQAYNVTGSTVRTAFVLNTDIYDSTTNTTSDEWVGTYQGDPVYRGTTKPGDGAQYRVGDLVFDTTYKVKVYTLNTTAVNNATTAVNNAQTNYNSLKAIYDAAKSTLNAAEATLLAEDPEGLPEVDVCGKRLQSCRLRFGNNATLPFGSFPGLYLTN
jgi:lambda family phage minor tail protein L